MDKVVKLIVTLAIVLLLWWATFARGQLEHLTTPREWTVNNTRVTAFYLSSTEELVRLRLNGSNQN